MRRTLLTTLALLALVPATLSASPKGPVDVEYLRAIAFDKGIVDIKEIELDDGVWEVEGRDATGRKIEIEVDAGTGEIVKIKHR
jgi:uncharacterized membrane protein YkoI